MPARPFRPIPHALYYEIHQTGPLLSATGVYNVAGCISTAALPSVADCIAVNAVLTAWCADPINGPIALMPPQAKIDFHRVWSQAEEGGPEDTAFEAVTGTGAAATVTAPACLALLETALHSRGVNGRWFWGPVPGDAIGSDGFITNGYASKVLARLTFLFAALQTAGYSPAVLSQKYGIGRLFTTVIVQTKVAYQTRRGTGGD